MHQSHSSQTYNSHINFDMLISELGLLKELADSSTIVVEGKRDAEALRSLGIDADFRFISDPRGNARESISGGVNSVTQLAESLSERGKEVIVLTDFDSKGSELCAKLLRALNSTAKKVKINTQVRKNLVRAFNGAKIGEIEDLKSLIENSGVDINGKNRNRSNKIHNSRETHSHRSG